MNSQMTQLCRIKTSFNWRDVRRETLAKHAGLCFTHKTNKMHFRIAVGMSNKRWMQMKSFSDDKDFIFVGNKPVRAYAH